MALKTSLLLSPVLWLRKIILVLLVLVVLLALLFYFVANSPQIIRKAADTFAPDYNISYSRIHGNVLTGVEIEDLRYNNEPLVKHARLKWNPNALVKKELMVNDLSLKGVDVHTLQKLLDSFASEENATTSTDSKALDLSVKVRHLEIDIAPFVEHNIEIKHSTLETKNITYNTQGVDIADIHLAIDTNVSKVHLDASLKDAVVEVNSLHLLDVDVMALQTLLPSDKNSSSVAKKETHNQSNTSNPMIPKRVHIKEAKLSLLPLSYAPVEMDSFVFELTKATFDIATLVLEEGEVVLKSETNVAALHQKGKIDHNKLLATLSIAPKQALYEIYDLPLNPKALKRLEVNLDASQTRVIAHLDTQMMQLLKAKKDDFNLDIERLKSSVTYLVESATLNAVSTVRVSTPYAKNIMIHNTFKMDENISYKGDIFIKQMIGLDPKLVAPANDLNISYQGDDKSIKTKLVSKMLQGSVVSDDFKHGRLHLESKEAFWLRDFVTLPAELNASKASVRIDAPLDFDANASYHAIAKIRSNVVNIDANISYDDTMHLRTLIDVPKNALLRPYSEALKWDEVMPLYADIRLKDEHVDARLNAGKVSANAQYDLNTSVVDANVMLSGLKTTITGSVNETMHLNLRCASIPSLVKSISDIYTLEDIPKIEGSVGVSIDIEALKKVNLSLNSPLLVYHADHKTSTEIKDIDVLLHYEENNVTLQHYKVTYDKEKIFATKPSHIFLNGNLVTIKPLWVNDQLHAQGSYDLVHKKGKIVLNADSLHLAHEIIDLDSAIDVTTLLDGNKTSVKGKIILLGGDIHYDISQKSFASDSDIVVLQDKKEQNKSPFMDNLSVELQVKSQKPLVYNKDAIHMKAKVDVGVHKAEHSELLVLGSIEILEGSTYIFENKKFVLKKSFVHFTGNPNKPLLDIKVSYKSINYLVTIAITGSADLPNITFSSKPSLSKEQILSLILFDTETAAGTNSGNDMMKMMGGAMAKSALNNIGVQLDHLVLGEGNSVEVGKKISDKMTIIYINGDVATVKLKYEHSKHTESVIGASEVSQSYDIIYKTDF